MQSLSDRQGMKECASILESMKVLYVHILQDIKLICTKILQ